MGVRRLSLLLYRLDLNNWIPTEGPFTIDKPIPYNIDYYLGAIVASRVADGKTIGYMHYVSGMVYVSEVKRKMFMDGQYIYRVFTIPEMRRQGVARNLLKRTLNEIVRETDGQARYVFAVIAVDNLSSRKLFEGAGFIPVKKLHYSQIGDRESYEEEDIPLRDRARSSTP